MPDTDRLKSILVGLALAENMGDVNDYLPRLCDELGLPRPEWDDNLMRYVMAWEEGPDLDADRREARDESDE